MGLAVLAGDSEMYSLTGSSTVSSSNTSHSCRVTKARNLAASCGGGPSKSIIKLYQYRGYSPISPCFTTRTIFPRSVYTSGNVKKDSVGAMMRERMRIKRLELEAARRAAESAPVATSGTAADTITAGATLPAATVTTPTVEHWALWALSCWALASLSSHLHIVFRKFCYSNKNCWYQNSPNDEQNVVIWICYITNARNSNASDL